MNRNIKLKSSFDGLNIAVLAVDPDTKPVAVLHMAHGMCGYKERYLPFFSFLSQNGIVCVAEDHRGHGESVLSEKDRGYMYSGGYGAIVDDMKTVTDWAHESYPDLPVFLLGHSMGSLAARAFTKKYDNMLSGLILCGSPSRNDVSYPAYILARFISMFHDGRIRMSYLHNLINRRYNKAFSEEGPLAWLCSDRAVCKAYAENPTSDFTFTADASVALMGLFLETYSKHGWQVSNPELPIYFISGEDDPCMLGEPNFHDSVYNMVNVGYHDVTSAIYSGMRHEVLNEIGKETVWQDILKHLILWTACTREMS